MRIQHLIAAGYSDSAVKAAMRGIGMSEKSTAFYLSKIKEHPGVKRQIRIAQRPKERPGRNPKARAKRKMPERAVRFLPF